MLGAARQRVEASAGCTMSRCCLGDAQVLAFEPAAFDVATSRMGVMFFADPVAAFRNIGGALKPGGRLGLRLLGAARGEPALADLLRHRAPPSGAAGTVNRSRAWPARLCRPRLYPPDPRGGRFRRDRGRAGAPDDHRQQSRGRSAAGADDGTDGTADRGEAARRGDASGDRPARSRRRSRPKPAPARSGCRQRSFWSPRAVRAAEPRMRPASTSPGGSAVLNPIAVRAILARVFVTARVQGTHEAAQRDIVRHRHHDLHRNVGAGRAARLDQSRPGLP